MSTKIKGETIKDGSIPLIALGNDIKNELKGKFGYYNFLAEFTTDNQIEIPPYGGYLYIVTNNELNI